MEVGIGEGRAVRRDQQLRPLEIRGPGGDQLDLHRPVGQLALRLPAGCRGGGLFVGQLADGRAGAAGMGPVPGGLSRLHRRLVIGGSLPLLKGNGPGGTGRQAVPQPVAVVLPHELSLAVHHVDGALVAGPGAGPAAVALVLVYVNDPANHEMIPPYFMVHPAVYAGIRYLSVAIATFFGLEISDRAGAAARDTFGKLCTPIDGFFIFSRQIPGFY